MVLKLAVCSFADDQFTHDPATRKAGRHGEAAQHFLFEGGNENWKDSAACLVDDSHGLPPTQEKNNKDHLPAGSCLILFLLSVLGMAELSQPRNRMRNVERAIYSKSTRNKQPGIDSLLLLPMSLLMEGIEPLRYDEVVYAFWQFEGLTVKAGS